MVDIEKKNIVAKIENEKALSRLLVKSEAKFLEAKKALLNAEACVRLAKKNDLRLAVVDIATKERTYPSKTIVIGKEKDDVTDASNRILNLDINDSKGACNYEGQRDSKKEVENESVSNVMNVEKQFSNENEEEKIKFEEACDSGISQGIKKISEEFDNRLESLMRTEMHELASETVYVVASTESQELDRAIDIETLGKSTKAENVQLKAETDGRQEDECTVLKQNQEPRKSKDILDQKKEEEDGLIVSSRVNEAEVHRNISIDATTRVH
eukprot:scaffold108311_cov37-Attheya_sp.AAC.1